MIIWTPNCQKHMSVRRSSFVSNNSWTLLEKPSAKHQLEISSFGCTPHAIYSKVQKIDLQKAKKANKAKVRSQNHQKVMRKSKKSKKTNSANQPGGTPPTPPPLNLAFAVPVQKTNKLAPTPPLVDGSGLVLGVFFMVLIRLHEECHQNSKIQADVCQIVFAKVWNC